MGLTVMAQCDCGYEETLPIGGGRGNFDVLCWFPCFCRECRRIVVANLMESQITCPVCNSHEIVPYDQSELCDHQGGAIVASWDMKERIGRKLILTDGAYFCPSRKEFGIRFVEGDLCWD